MENLKLLKTDSDIMIECLTKRIQDLEFMNLSLRKRNENLQKELTYFDKMSRERPSFIKYLKFKAKIKEILEERDLSENYTKEDLKSEFEIAVKNMDLDNVSHLFDKAVCLKDNELLALLQEKENEMSDLNDEIDYLKERISELE